MAHGEAEKHLGFNTVEYAVRNMFKGHSIAASAKKTAEKFNGAENIFLAPPGTIVNIDKVELEEALWDRMVNRVISGIGRMKPGFEHYALDGTIDFYHQTRFKKERVELKERVIEHLGRDPFSNDG